MLQVQHFTTAYVVMQRAIMLYSHFLLGQIAYSMTGVFVVLFVSFSLGCLVLRYLFGCVRSFLPYLTYSKLCYTPPYYTVLVVVLYHLAFYGIQ